MKCGGYSSVQGQRSYSSPRGAIFPIMILLGLLTITFSASLSTATPAAATFVVNTSSPRVPFLSPWTKAIGSGHVSSLLVHSSAWHKLWYTQR